jgi:hypothetical protein
MMWHKTLNKMHLSHLHVTSASAVGPRVVAQLENSYWYEVGEVRYADKLTAPQESDQFCSVRRNHQQPLSGGTGGLEPLCLTAIIALRSNLSW